MKTTQSVMHLLVIEPLVGVNELKLGQVINHDTEFLGLSEDYIHRGDNWQTKYYWNGQLTVKYDDKNRVTHIGIRNLGKLSFEVVLFGRKVFETPVADMIDLITQTAKTRSHLKIILRAMPGPFPGIRRCSTLTERPAMRGFRA